MRVLLVNQSDGDGGAARAAYRLHCALREARVDARMLVQDRRMDHWSIAGPASPARKFISLLRAPMGAALMRLQRSGNAILHSPAMLPSRIPRLVREADPQVVNLHWVCGEMLRIEEIPRIHRAIVWTMHDMWPFCGTEHYTDDAPGARFEAGYRRDNCPPDHRGLDLDRWVWGRKRSAWGRPLQVVTPSNWLAGCVRRSLLMQDWPVQIIPNALDIDLFAPYDRALCRHLFKLPLDKTLILFGAISGTRQPIKGFDLLAAAIQGLGRSAPLGWECVIFGQSEPRTPPDLSLPIHWIGQVGDQQLMPLIYSAADVMVVPSRMENLPQTATEAQACGCPVVAFDCTGMPDAVVHRKTGYLARAYDPQDLAAGITWVLGDFGRRRALEAAARDRAVRLWAAPIIARRYLDVYAEALEAHRTRAPGP